VRDVVRERLQVFGSAGACTLSGNICLSHGACGVHAAKDGEAVIQRANRPLQFASEGVPLQDKKVVAAVISQVVSEVLKEMGK
jgi:hypothetical protein